MKLIYCVITDHLLEAEGHGFFVFHGKKKMIPSCFLYRSSVFLQKLNFRLHLHGRKSRGSEAYMATSVIRDILPYHWLE
jgi:hypothetical protein